MEVYTLPAAIEFGSNTVHGSASKSSDQPILSNKSLFYPDPLVGLP